MLKRVGGDFRPDQVLDQIQQPRVGDEAEDRRAEMHRRVVAYPVARQRNVHRLKPVATGAIGRQQLALEIELFRVRGHVAFGKPRIVKTVQKIGIFTPDRRDDPSLVENPVDDQITVLLEEPRLPVGQ